MRFKLGCDPEVFLSDGQNFVSAHGLFPGTKKEPFKVERGAVQVDGLALEFNIDPADTAEEFSRNIETVKRQMEEMVNKVNPALRMTFVPFARFDLEYFRLLPLDCKILGCEPDFDIEGKQKVPDPELQDRPFRTAAGHVHIGWTENQEPHEPKHFEDARFVAEMFVDEPYFLPKTKEEKERVFYYGQPGSFRPKSYGTELRSMSNIWVKSPISHKKVFNIIAKRLTEIL